MASTDDIQPVHTPAATDARLLLAALVTLYRQGLIPDVTLTPEQSTIVYLRGVLSRTLADVATTVGMRREDVRQTEIRAFRMLRRAWQDEIV